MNLLRRLFTPVAVCCAAILAAPSASAQGTPITPRHVVSINPFLPLAGYFQGEYEQRVRDNLSVAVSGAHIRLDDLYTSTDFKLRFYPSGRALQGFGLSVGVGFGRVENDDIFYDCVVLLPGEPGSCPESRGKSATGPSASVEAQYQWLLGKSRNTAVAVGAGAKRFYVDDQKPLGYELFREFVPTLRLTVGYAFR
jgi:hypothetical protein